MKICGYRCRRVRICGYRCRRVKRLNVKLMQDFELAVKQDGQLICEVKASLTDFFSVRSTYNKVTGAISLIRKLTLIASWSSMA